MWGKRLDIHNNFLYGKINASSRSHRKRGSFCATHSGEKSKSGLNRRITGAPSVLTIRGQTTSSAIDHSPVVTRWSARAILPGNQSTNGLGSKTSRFARPCHSHLNSTASAAANFAASARACRVSSASERTILEGQNQ